MTTGSIARNGDFLVIYGAIAPHERQSSDIGKAPLVLPSFRFGEQIAIKRCDATIAYTATLFSLSAFITTLNDDRAIAAAAMIGESNMAVNG